MRRRVCASGPRPTKKGVPPALGRHAVYNSVGDRRSDLLAVAVVIHIADRRGSGRARRFRGGGIGRLFLGLEAGEIFLIDGIRFAGR